MRKSIGAVVVLSSLGLFALSGCENGNEPVGGPGADVRTDEDQEPQQEEATFTASLEEEEIEAPLGEKKELKISIERGDQFEQTVTAQIQTPEGLTVTPDTIEYQAGQQEAKVFIEAAPGAEVGKELAVEITFEPETGQPITKQLKVTVVESDKQQAEKEQQQPEQQPQPEQPQPDAEQPQAKEKSQDKTAVTEEEPQDAP